MGRARRWAGIALSGLVMASLCLIAAGPVRAAEDVLGWDVNGSVEAGGIYSFGERGSSKFEDYRDMDNGFVGDLTLRGEKKDQPYFFELDGKNPARDDQLYDGAFGEYGTFRLDLGWDRVRSDLSNSGQTIFQQSGDQNNLPPNPLRATIASTLSPTAPTTVVGNVNNIANTINGLLRPVSLGFNTDMGGLAFKFTPLADLRFDLDYNSIHRQGERPLGTVIGSPGGSVTELAVPVDNWTNEVKFGTEYARPDWALQFNYTGSFFHNDFNGYTWDNPLTATNNATGLTARDRISAAPDNMAHTLSLTGTGALPLQTRINGTFAYTMLRQDETFIPNTQNPALNPTNKDLAGNSSPDEQVNTVLTNIVVTSRPIHDVTVTARYRYFEYQNDTPEQVFSAVLPTGEGPVTAANEGITQQERYTKQNAGIDLGWHPISMLNLKAGYEDEHWNRGDFEGESFSTSENIGKFAADVTPVDWLLGRITYRYGNRTTSDFVISQAATAENPMLPQSTKFDYAPRTQNRVDALLQFSYWETLTPSISGGYALDNYRDNQFGLLNDDYWTVGANLDWSPVKWLTIGGDYSYERYDYKMESEYLSGATSLVPANNWISTDKDEFHNVGVNATLDIIPKKFNVTLGYNAAFGYTTIKTSNPNFSAATSSSATAYPWDKVFNVLQTFRITAKYNLTEKLSLRGGFAYERYAEKDFARDPMQPFMGVYDQAVPGGPLVSSAIQSVFLGATVPSYESYTLSGSVRYEF